jgi:hypothetical protein
MMDVENPWLKSVKPHLYVLHATDDYSAAALPEHY